MVTHTLKDKSARLMKRYKRPAAQREDAPSTPVYTTEARTEENISTRFRSDHTLPGILYTSEAEEAEAHCSSITENSSSEPHPTVQGDILVAKSQQEVEMNQVLLHRGPEDDVNFLISNPTVPPACNIDVKVEAPHLYREIGKTFTCPVSFMTTVLVDSGQNIGSGGGANILKFCRHAWHLPA